MTVAPTRRLAEEQPADSPDSWLARLRAQAVAANPTDDAMLPAARPSPLGGATRAAPVETPAWGDSGPAPRRIEPLRLAVLGVLAAILLIVGFGVTQRLAQSHPAPRAATVAQPVALAVPAAPATAPAASPLAIMPPPPVVATPSAQLSAIKQALGGDDAAHSDNAASVPTALGSAVLSTTAAPPAAPTPAATAQPSTGWGGATGPAAAGATAADGFVDVQGSANGPVVGSAPQPGAAIVWPVVGPLTSCFCPYHPLGIDIGVPLNTPVRAMAAGTVAFAGGNACCSYGYYVDIDHGNGIMTRYGHLSYIPAIPIGTVVRPGDIIGMSGTTGYSTGPHLHFEVRLHGVPVNPLDVLP